MSKFTKPTLLRTSRTDPPCTYHPTGGGRDAFCVNPSRVPTYCSNPAGGNLSSRPSPVRGQFGSGMQSRTDPAAIYRPSGGGRDMFIARSPPSAYGERGVERGLTPRPKDVCYRSPERASTANSGRYISPEVKQARRRQQQAHARSLSTPLSFRNKWVATRVLGKRTMFSDPQTLKLASAGTPISAC